MTWENLYWEDIKEGQEIPTVTRDITTTTVVSCAIASRDFTPLHHDRDAVVAAGLRDVFINTPTIYGFAGKYLTDWTGPEGELKQISLRLMMPACTGDTLTITGKVARKYAEEGFHLADVEFTFGLQEMPNCTGKATVALPTKSSS